MLDWLFGREKKNVKIRGYLDKNGNPRVQLLDARPADQMIKRTLLVTSARSFDSVQQAREVMKLVEAGGTISDEFDAVNPHD